MRAWELLNEKWSDKYKRSINCDNPKGFSQRAHCQGRKKANEDVDDSTALNNYSDVLMVLGQIQREIKDKNIKPEIPTQMVIDYIQNAGIDGFDYEDLVKANEELPAMKEILKNITPEKITVTTGVKTQVSNPQDKEGSVVTNPEQTVTNMAKSALKRRQD